MRGIYPFGRDVFSLWLEAPLVIAMRLQQMQMAMLTGTAPNTAEMNRMVTEKMAAAIESAIAANFAFLNAVMTAEPLSMAAREVSNAALKPYGKRVRSNVRRLSSRKG